MARIETPMGINIRLILGGVIVVLMLCATDMSYAFRLPDTGQTKCYRSVSPYDEIPCAGTGQDGAYNINPMFFTDNGLTVTDNNTGLVWQKQDDGNIYNWYQASGTYHATYNVNSTNVCDTLTLAGFSDWRLPSKKELITIVDYSIVSPGPNISPLFTNTKWFPYWTSSTFAKLPDYAWHVDFNNGRVYPILKVGGNLWYVRCVRGGEPASLSEFRDSGSTITDVRTGLVWQKSDDGITRTWDAALSYCEGLNLASQTDWRLPNNKELESITDDSSYNPSINPVFTGTQAAYYWSSTTNAYSPDLAYYIDFYNGSVNYIGSKVSNSSYVRCVRAGQSGSLGNLTISELGAGSGTVVSSPAGINCGGTCSAFYPISSVVELAATPSTGGSIFSGWSGDPDCADGIVTLSVDTSCTATFSLCDSSSVAITDLSGPFSSISAAYAGAASTDTIRIIASNQQEGDLVFNNKSLTLQGGYDCAFTEPPTSFTTITGSLTISGGSVSIGWIRIQ